MLSIINHHTAKTVSGNRSNHVTDDSFVKLINSCNLLELCMEMTALRYSKVPIYEIKVDLYDNCMDVSITSAKAKPLDNNTYTDVSGLVKTLNDMKNDKLIHGDLVVDNRNRSKSNIVIYNDELCLVDFGIVTGINNHIQQTQSYFNFDNSDMLVSSALDRANTSLDIMIDQLANRDKYLDTCYTSATTNIPFYKILMPNYLIGKLGNKSCRKQHCDCDVINIDDLDAYRQLYDECSKYDDGLVRLSCLLSLHKHYGTGLCYDIMITPQSDILYRLYNSYMNTKDNPMLDYYVCGIDHSYDLVRLYAGMPKGASVNDIMSSDNRPSVIMMFNGYRYYTM